jgi:FHS family L-fucose permease-like MFS transporter
MVTAIVGGAIVPPIMGFVSDRSSMQLGFLVPLAAIVYITAIALANQKNRAAEAVA